MSTATDIPSASGAPATSGRANDWKDYLSDSQITSNLRRRSVRGGAVTIAAQGAKFVLQVGTGVVLARLLTPGDYGLVAIVTAITVMVSVFREAGLSSATVQRPGITHAEVTGLFWLNLALGAAVMAGLLALAPGVAWFYHRSELVPVMCAFAGIGFIDSFAVQHNALLQRRMEFKALAIRDLTGQVAGVAAGIASAALGARYWALVIMQAVSSLVSTIVLWTGCPWRPGRPRPFQEVKSLVLFGAHVTGSNFFGYLTKGLDRLLIGYFFGTDPVGLYSRAQNLLAMPMSQLLNPIMSVARPALSRAAEDQQRLTRVTLELVGLVAFASAFVVALVLPMSDLVVRLLLGPKWSACVPIFAALAPFALVEPIASLLGTVLVAAGRPDALLKWRFVSVTIIVGGMIGGLVWGPFGVAAVYAGTGLLVRTPWFMWFVSRHTSIRFSALIRVVLPSTLAGAACAALVWMSRRYLPEMHPIVGCVVLGSMTLVLYTGLTAITAQGRQTLAQVRKTIASVVQQRRAVPLAT